MPPTFAACPIEIVDAPASAVWALLTDFSGWGDFYDVRVTRVEPPGPAHPGQVMHGENGPRFLHLRVRFEFTLLDEKNHALEFQIQLPFGIQVHEVLDIRTLSPDRCRVNYHCNFTLPQGIRGAILRLLLHREFKTGPTDSLQRLKKAAEARAKPSTE